MKRSEEAMNLIENYLSGQADEEQVQRLEGMMIRDAGLRAEFLLHSRIEAALPGLLNPDQLKQVHSDKKIRWQFWGPLAAAAVLLLMFAFGDWGKNPGLENQAPLVAEFSKLSSCRWVDEDRQVLKGDGIRVGERFELSAGEVEIAFETGARLVLVGPAIAEVRSRNGIFLTMGEATLEARTSESKGFTIETPSSTIVDISTAFTTTVSPDGLSRVDVTEGEVDVVVSGKSGQRRLRAGESMLVEPGSKKIVTRIEAGDATVGFQFPTISPPGNSDYADQSNKVASIQVMDHKSSPLSERSGAIASLLDGRGQSASDAPGESVFFQPGRVGRFVIDLGKPVSISRINTYSWHQHEEIDHHRDRARQRFTLFGLSEEQADSFRRVEKPLQNGWTRIARVNSDRFFNVSDRFDRPAQQACSISADEGEIGKYRYLLWVVDAGSFYGEIDVFLSTD